MTSHDILGVVLIVGLTLFSAMAFTLVAYWFYGLMEIIKMEHAERRSAMSAKD
jgi:hypothetical protein